METTEKILKLAAENRQQAFRVIEQSNVIGCWQSVGARINLIGSPASASISAVFSFFKSSGELILSRYAIFFS